MKIYSSKIDDIRRARDEWDAETARRDSIREEERKRYQKAEDAIIAPVDYQISTALNKFDILDFDVNIAASGGYRGSRGLEVRINCNENRVHDEDSALSWNWSVFINGDGEVVKNSGSWSGLNATTEANMKSLRQSVEALEYLNSVDWASIIDVQTPDWGDYYSTMEPRGTKPNFDQQLKEAELEECIGKDIMLLGYSMPEYESRWNNSVKTWFIILGETPKQYRVGEISAFKAQYMIKDGKTIEDVIDDAKHYSSRYRKDRIISALKYPFIKLDEQTVDSVMSRNY